MLALKNINTTVRMSGEGGRYRCGVALCLLSSGTASGFWMPASLSRDETLESSAEMERAPDKMQAVVPAIQRFDSTEGKRSNGQDLMETWSKERTELVHRIGLLEIRLPAHSDFRHVCFK